MTRFTLKAILGCTAALCVALGLIAGGSEMGIPALVVVVCCCIGFLEGVSKTGEPEVSASGFPGNQGTHVPRSRL